MHPDSIKTKEKTFFDTLKLSSGRRFTLTGTTTVGSSTIYSIRPADLTYFYQQATPKKSICLHFTVGNIMSDIDVLSKPGNHVSVSYVIDRAGRIYELFPDTYWSYHLGSGTIGGNAAMSKQTVGIEISNYGPLDASGDKLLDAYKNTYCKLSETGYYEKVDYRGHGYYATMTPEQIVATADLIKYISGRHSIELNFTGTDTVFKNATEALAFNGVFYHSNVRKDKFDWPFGESIKAVIAAATPKPAPAEPYDKVCADPARAPKAEKPTTKKTTTTSKSPWNFMSAIESLFSRLF